MSRIVVAPIVEGHGEVAAVPILLTRLWYEMFQGEYIHVQRPFRIPRDRIIGNHEGILKNAIDHMVQKLNNSRHIEDNCLILILFDADTDPACRLGPEILSLARNLRPDADTSCAVAVVEYETWFVAAAPSLSDHLVLPDQIPDDPEKSGSGKGWIQRHFKGVKYSETVDQPKLTAAMDLAMCRSRSASFDKLCRELEARKSS